MGLNFASLALKVMHVISSTLALNISVLCVYADGSSSLAGRRSTLSRKINRTDGYVTYEGLYLSLMQPTQCLP